MPTAIPVYYVPGLAMGSYGDLAAVLGTSLPLLRPLSIVLCLCSRANANAPSLRGSVGLENSKDITRGRFGSVVIVRGALGTGYRPLPAGCRPAPERVP
jgi:hypothetical protein